MRQIAQRSGREKGVSLILVSAAMIAIIPLMGLIVDVGFIYGAKTQLQAAVDGASLAAARAISLDASGQTTIAQANATSWFNANYPTGTWGTTNITLTTPNVYQDTTYAALWHVNVTASATVPTYFMRWFGAPSTIVTSIGNATRRSVVAMLVLDRSASMCTDSSGTIHRGCGSGSYACGAMISAAKEFTGQFAAGRDYIGMVTFNSGIYVTYPTATPNGPSPDTGFRTTLGYTDTNGVSGSGAIDNIQCNGGTATSEGLSVGYNELVRASLPGALNVLILETDGLPNAMSVPVWDGSKYTISSTSGCLDANNKTKTNGGWATQAAGSTRQWSAAHTFGTNSHYSNISAGPFGTFYTGDTSGFIVLFSPWAAGNTGDDITAAGSGCGWSSASTSSIADFGSLPPTDIFGNALRPSHGTGYPYNPVTLTGSDVSTSGSASVQWTNIHGAAENTLDDAAYNARNDTTLKPVIYAIALGGNAGGQPDLTLLQRVANDPNGDTFNTSLSYPTTFEKCSLETSCVTNTSQSEGLLVYSASYSVLRQSFLAISSQILRLSQ